MEFGNCAMLASGNHCGLVSDCWLVLRLMYTAPAEQFDDKEMEMGV